MPVWSKGRTPGFRPGCRGSIPRTGALVCPGGPSGEDAALVRQRFGFDSQPGLHGSEVMATIRAPNPADRVRFLADLPHAPQLWLSKSGCNPDRQGSTPWWCSKSSWQVRPSPNLKNGSHKAGCNFSHLVNSLVVLQASVVQMEGPPVSTRQMRVRLLPEVQIRPR